MTLRGGDASSSRPTSPAAGPSSKHGQRSCKKAEEQCRQVLQSKLPEFKLSYGAGQVFEQSTWWDGLSRTKDGWSLCNPSNNPGPKLEYMYRFGQRFYVHHLLVSGWPGQSTKTAVIGCSSPQSLSGTLVTDVSRLCAWSGVKRIGLN